MQPYAPFFSEYGPEVGAYLTQFLLADPRSNPNYWNQPDKWPSLYPFLRMQVRTLNFSTAELTGAVSVSKNLSLVGGRNSVLMWRAATVHDSESVGSNNFTECPELVLYQQDTASGIPEIAAVPISTVFNTAASPGDRNGMLKVPETWLGKDDRVITLTGLSATAMAVRLVYHTATLLLGSNAAMP